MSYSFEILKDVSEEVQGLDVLEWGLEGLAIKLGQMEETA